MPFHPVHINWNSILENDTYRDTSLVPTVRVRVTTSVKITRSAALVVSERRLPKFYFLETVGELRLPQFYVVVENTTDDLDSDPEV